MHLPPNNTLPVTSYDDSISVLVSRPDCTLEDVLDHADLHKELRKDGESEHSGVGGMAMLGNSMYRSGIDFATLPIYNSTTVDWLCKTENLLSMIQYITEETPSMWVVPEQHQAEKEDTEAPITDDSQLHEDSREGSPALKKISETESIFAQIPRVTLTDFGPLSEESLSVNLRDYYYDVNYPGENAWCRLTLDPPQETDTNVSHKAIYKFPFVVHELLTESCKRLLDAMASNNEVLEKLFSFFSRRRPLNPVLLGYAGSLISTLMSKYRICEFFEVHEDRVLDDLFFHLENRSVAEILKMLIFEERGVVKDPESLVHRLFDCMDVSKWPCDILVGERQENVFLIVRELIHSDKSCPWHNRYMHIIMSSSIPDNLMEAVFHWHKSTVTSSIGILVELLMYLDPLPEEPLHERFDENSCGNVVTDFDSSNKQTDLDVPPDHRYEEEEEDPADVEDRCNLLQRLCLEPPLYPLDHVDDSDASTMTASLIDIYISIWSQYQIVPGLEKEEDKELDQDDANTAENLKHAEHMGYENGLDGCDAPVEQYPAPPRLYKSSGEFFDMRLRKYIGRLLVDILEPLTSAAIAHRDRRRNKNNRPGRRKCYPEDEDEEAEAEFGGDNPRDVSMSPFEGHDKIPNGTICYEPATESCEPMRKDLLIALYPDPSNPSHPIADPYFTIDWYRNPQNIPPCDPNHPALQHLLDVVPPEYTFSEYQNGRKVSSGLAQNAFQNGVRSVVGHRLLEILHLFRAFVRVQGSNTFHLYIAKILKCVHSLLFAHKWNSILHISLGDIIIFAVQREPTVWPEAISTLITDSGFFQQASRFIRRYVRYKKELCPEPRMEKKNRLHSGALPVVLEILRIFQDLAKCSDTILELIRRVCPEWHTFAPALEDLNAESIEWTGVPNQMTHEVEHE